MKSFCFQKLSDCNTLNQNCYNLTLPKIANYLYNKTIPSVILHHKRQRFQAFVFYSISNFAFILLIFVHRYFHPYYLLTGHLVGNRFVILRHKVPKNLVFCRFIKVGNRLSIKVRNVRFW